MHAKFFKIIQSFSLSQKLVSVGFLFFIVIIIPFFVLHIPKNTQGIKKEVAAAHITLTFTPTFTIAPTHPVVNSIALHNIQITETPTTMPTTIPIAITTKVITQNTNTTNNQQSNNSIPTAQTSPTPFTQQTVTVTQNPTSTVQNVNIQIVEPDGTFHFQVDLHNGNNACDILQTAKTEGKIKSLTLDDSYISSLHSLYVKEMNTFSNNWTFTVNGSSPLGCSLVNPKPNDQIDWKFG